MDGEISFLQKYIRQSETKKYFGGFCWSQDKNGVGYAGVWGKRKASKLRRILRERGAIFEVVEIDESDRNIGFWTGIRKTRRMIKAEERKKAHESKR
jgi:predicted acetyltransferase